MVVAATVDGAASSGLLPVLDRVRVQLAVDGRSERWPDVLLQPEAVPVSDARALGRAAFSALATGRPAAATEAYAGKIEGALQGASMLRDAESRSVLWNLCALRVHMRVLSDDPAVRGEGVREAAADCLRRFRERPPLGKSWPEEVVRAFDDAARSARVSSVALKSAPAGCEVFVYGASVGLTPLLLDLAHGVQEVQVSCEGRWSALHRIAVEGPRELVVRMATDAALAEGAAGLGLRYVTPESLGHALAEDAATLAVEAGADGFVTLVAHGTDTELTWQPLGRGEARRVHVAGRASAELRAQLVASLFHSPPAVEAAPVVPVRRGISPVFDYLLGGALVAGGVALATPAFVALARDGECANGPCTEVYNGNGGTGIAMFVGAGALVGSGVAWLIWRPLSRYTGDTALSVGAGGLRVRGSF
jgi:PEGA domain